MHAYFYIRKINFPDINGKNGDFTCLTLDIYSLTCKVIKPFPVKLNCTVHRGDLVYFANERGNDPFNIFFCYIYFVCLDNCPCHIKRVCFCTQKNSCIIAFILSDKKICRLCCTAYKNRKHTARLRVKGARMTYFFHIKRLAHNTYASVRRTAHGLIKNYYSTVLIVHKHPFKLSTSFLSASSIVTFSKVQPAAFL